MRAPAKPADEEKRLGSLYRSGLLEGFADHRIKVLTELATRLLKRPAAALSLITNDRQVSRASVNLKDTNIARDESLCSHAILQPDQAMIVEDALLDPRFADNPRVTARRLPIRFYAGIPIRTSDGQPIGVLCVLDHVPGKVTDNEIELLRKIAGEIEDIIRELDDSGATPELLHELQQALVAKTLKLYWQPIIRTDTLQPVCHEALVRLERPDGSLVKPSHFMALAATSGLITRVDRFVLQAACATVASRDDCPRVSVNVSSAWLEFISSALTDVVSQTLSRTGLAPDRLVIELGESILVRDPTRTLREMQSLKQLGVHVALDQFGTGYSASGFIAGFPFDMLKMDKAIVSELGDNPRAEAVAYSVIRLAHDLGKSVCAVGVEAGPQLAFLRAEGCDLVQGNLLGEPGPQLA